MGALSTDTAVEGLDAAGRTDQSPIFGSGRTSRRDPSAGPAATRAHTRAPACTCLSAVLADRAGQNDGHDDSSSQGVGILAPMTETEDVTTSTGVVDAKAHEAVIDEALRLIDTGLSDLMHRELVSTDEVSDLLLDVRMLLTAAEMATASGPLVEAPIGA